MNPFDKKDVKYWAIYQAIAKAASDFAGLKEIDSESIYGFLDKCPKTSLSVHIADALEELGFKIVKS